MHLAIARMHLECLLCGVNFGDGRIQKAHYLRPPGLLCLPKSSLFETFTNDATLLERFEKWSKSDLKSRCFEDTAVWHGETFDSTARR